MSFSPDERTVYGPASAAARVIGAPDDQSDNYRVRLILMAQLRAMMKARRLTQMQAASWFHVSQCRISHLVNGRVNRFTTDTLINMLAHAGVQIHGSFCSRRLAGLSVDFKRVE